MFTLNVWNLHAQRFITISLGFVFFCATFVINETLFCSVHLSRIYYFFHRLLTTPPFLLRHKEMRLISFVKVGSVTAASPQPWQSCRWNTWYLLEAPAEQYSSLYDMEAMQDKTIVILRNRRTAWVIRSAVYFIEVLVNHWSGQAPSNKTLACSTLAPPKPPFSPPRMTLEPIVPYNTHGPVPSVSADCPCGWQFLSCYRRKQS